MSMLPDFAAKLANLVAGYSTDIKPGDVVVINAGTAAEEYLFALCAAIVERGGHPLVNLRLPGLDEVILDKASDAQLDFLDPRSEVLVEKADVYMVVMADTNTKALSSIAPEKIARARKAGQQVFQRMLERMGTGEMRYQLSLWPTASAAQEAEMGLLAYSRFVYEACALTEPDPIAYWQAFRAKQLALSKWLSDKQHAEVKGPGIDITFDFADRVWYSAHGKLNMPDGEIFTGPIEDSVNGRVEFSYPTIYQGREVNGIALTFKDGRVVEASADKGEDFLLSTLDTDPGARVLGEFAIGTNKFVQQYSGNTLFDEKIGGTIHMAVGASIPQTKGINQSAVHWDIVHGMRDGGEIWIDGELFYRSGEFMIEG